MLYRLYVLGCCSRLAPLRLSPVVRHAAACVLALACGFVSSGCTENENAPSDASGSGASIGVVVVASIHPLAGLAGELMGDLGEAHALLPAGSTPHGFSPTPDALRKLRSADLLLTVGRGLDPWAKRLVDRLEDPPRVLDLAEIAERAGAVDAHTPALGPADHPHDHDHHNHHNQEHAHVDHADHADHSNHADHNKQDHAHDHDHLGPNPHLWLDPHAVEALVRELAAAVEFRRPEEQQAVLHANRDDLLRRIDEIDRAYRQKLSELPNPRMVTFHNAFDPLAERYGLEVVAHLTPIGLGGGGEVTPGRLEAAIRAIRQHNVPAVYVEPQFSDAVVRRLAEQTGVQVLTLDPLGNPHIEGRRGWFELMRFNLEALVKGQSK